MSERLPMLYRSPQDEVELLKAKKLPVTPHLKFFFDESVAVE